MTTWLRRWWWPLLPILGTVVALGIGIVLSVQLASTATPLMEQAAQITDPKERVAAFKDVAQYQIDNQIKIWTGIVQAIGVVVLAVGGYFTWRNLRATQAKLDIDREGQITNRFTQAVAQLGAELKDGQPNLEVRLGGIYALERIARDSTRDHWTIMEVLTAYVRQNAPWAPPPDTEEASTEDERQTEQASPVSPRTDIQAILTVLGRRVVPEAWPEISGLDLSRTDLRGAYLYKAHLRGAYLVEAHLERANLYEVHLEQANLTQAHLEQANLTQAHLGGTILTQAHLERASLTQAHLEGAVLYEAHLERASLARANLEGASLSRVHLERAVLYAAHLEGVYLDGAHLEGTLLDGVHLERADLRGVRGLTLSQVQAAHDAGMGAHLPEDLQDLSTLPIEPAPADESSQPAPETT